MTQSYARQQSTQDRRTWHVTEWSSKAHDSEEFCLGLCFVGREIRRARRGLCLYVALSLFPDSGNTFFVCAWNVNSWYTCRGNVYHFVVLEIAYKSACNKYWSILLVLGARAGLVGGQMTCAVRRKNARCVHVLVLNTGFVRARATRTQGYVV